MKNPRPFIRSFFSIFRASREKATSFVSTRSLLQEMSSVLCVSLVSNYLKAWTKFDPFSIICLASDWDKFLLMSSSTVKGTDWVSSRTTFLLLPPGGGAPAVTCSKFLLTSWKSSCTTVGKNLWKGVNGLTTLKPPVLRRRTRRAVRESWGAAEITETREITERREITEDTNNTEQDIFGQPSLPGFALH